MIDVDNIDVETLYIIGDARPAGARYVDPHNPVEQYVRTPDGRGCYWYDENQLDEAKTDVCDFRRTHYFETIEDFEDYRYREDD